MFAALQPAPDGTATLTWPGGAARCAIGRGGISADKREGDGATPAGTLVLRRVLYRPDRLDPPATALPVTALTPRDGWSDDASDPDYNQPVTLPHRWRHEVLWRQDPVYDVIVPLGWNDDPVVPGRGSAIFLHLARPGFAPTEGCLALTLPDLLAVLASAAPGSAITVPNPS